MSSETPPEAADGPCERMVALEEFPNIVEMRIPSPNLKGFLRTILESAKYSDLKILLKGGVQYSVHKNIVSKSCSYFEKLVAEAEASQTWGVGQPSRQSRGPLSNDIQETSTGPIEIAMDDPPNACYALVQFLYTRDYDIQSVMDNQIQAFFHLDVYVVAIKYKVDDLKHLAQLRFNQALQDEHSSGELIRDLVIKLYDTSVSYFEELKDFVSTYCAVHLAALLPEPQFLRTLAEMVEFCEDVSNAAFDIEGQILNLPCNWRPN